MGAVSQGSAGGLPGMNLKAWVVMTTAGAVVKSSNVSGVVRNSVGNFTVSFTAAMNGTEYVAKYTGAGGGVNALGGNALTRNTGNCIVVSSYPTGGNQTPVDAGGLWEFYE